MKKINIIIVSALSTIAFNTAIAGGVTDSFNTAIADEIVSKAYGLFESEFNSSLNTFANKYGSGQTDISVIKLKDGDTNYSITTVQPLSQTEDKSKTLFFQGSVYSFKNHDQKRPTINLGIGQRWLSPNKSTITGVNVFVDYETKSQHSRASLGGEYKRSAFEANTNVYWGLSSKRSVTVNGVAENEEVLDGWDVIVKGQVPYIPWASFTATHYKWNRDTKANIEGGKAGVEIALNSASTLEAGIQDDNDMNNSVYVELTYTFGVENKPTDFSIDSVAFRNNDDMTSHLLDKVERQNKIITSRGITMTVVKR